MELHNAAEILLKVASQKRQGTESKIHTIVQSLICTFGHYHWKAIVLEASNTGTPKLASYLGLLAPAFVACSTYAVEGLIKLSNVV